MKIDKKIFPQILVILLIFSIILNLILFRANRKVRQEMASASELMNAQLKEAILSNKEKIKQNLEEKYRADMVSYKALYERSKQLKEEIATLKEELAKKEKEIEKLNKKN